MKKIIAAAAVAATGFLGAGTALASGEILEVSATSEVCGQAVVTATLSEDFSGGDTYWLALFSGSNEGGEPDFLRTFPVTKGAPVTETVALAEDAYGNNAYVSWGSAAGPNPEFWVRGGAVGVTTDCAPPVEEPPTPSDPPVEPPAPSDPPTPSDPPVEQPPVEQPPVEQPPVEDVLYDNCTAVWEAIGRPLLAGEDGYETPRLDAEGDGIACEVDPRGTPPTTTTPPVAVDLVSNDTSGGDLAYTGASNVGLMIGGGAFLLAAGGAGVVLARRRSQV